ncbi:MAG: ROK family protein [Pseudomonadales bacterium]|nr:ROK family protein [Pseudomonadales bacterium]
MYVMGEYIGGIEAGGTTFRCAIARHPLDRIVEATIATGQPTETLRQVTEFFLGQSQISQLGLATFGPVSLDPRATNFGTLLDTPKLEWQGVNFRHELKSALDVPTHIETDVTGAAIAEYQYGRAQDEPVVAYVTVGTGIGGAILINGEPIPHLKHSEMGHIRVPRPSTDPFEGTCPFHNDCLEGLAAAPALTGRWQQDPKHLSHDHPAWDLQAYYLASLCTKLLRLVTPTKILLGGGIMNVSELLPKIHAQILVQLGGYHAFSPEQISTIVEMPALSPDSGLIGALELANRLRAKEAAEFV